MFSWRCNLSTFKGNDPQLPVTNTPNDKGDKAENVPTVAGHL